MKINNKLVHLKDFDGVSENSRFNLILSPFEHTVNP